MSGGGRLARGLRATAWGAFAGALAALAAPGAAGRWLAGVVLGVLVGAPLLVLGLGAGAWAREGRTGLAGIAVALLVVIGLGGVLVAVL